MEYYLVFDGTTYSVIHSGEDITDDLEIVEMSDDFDFMCDEADKLNE